MAVTLNKQISLAFNTSNIIQDWIWGFIEPYNITYDDLCHNSLYIIKQISNRMDWSWTNLHNWLISYAIPSSEIRPDYDSHQYENLVLINNFTRFLIRQKLVKHDEKIKDTVCLNNIDSLMQLFKNYRNRINSILQFTTSSRRNRTVINLANTTTNIINNINNNSDNTDNGYDSMPELI